MVPNPGPTRYIVLGAAADRPDDRAAERPARRAPGRDHLMAERLLELAGVSLAFGGLKCVSGLDLHVDEGEIVSVIGPNGAGQDDALQPDHRHLLAGRRRHPARRQQHRRSAAAPDHPARRRPDVPDPAAVPEHDREGERDVRGVRAHAGRPLPVDLPHARACAARSRRSPSSPIRGSRSSASG